MKITINKVVNAIDKSIGNGEFYNIEDKYILCIDSNFGMLLDRSGRVLWIQKWEHVIFYGEMYYIERFNILITSRLAMTGPVTDNLGICGIDMTNGMYLWKHWYEDGLQERMALKENKNDNIRLCRLDSFNLYGEFLINQSFKINVISGKYSVVESKCECNERLKTRLTFPKQAISDNLVYDKETSSFVVSIESVKLWGHRFAWYDNLISVAYKQKLFTNIKLYKIVEFFDDSILIIAKDLNNKNACIWLLK